ncbi:MAG: GreA/GreB family elongation factor [Kiritimatiellales bacterium]
MKNNVKSRKITLTFSDYMHLQDLVRAGRNIDFQPSTLLDALEAELNRAEIVASNAIPRYVFTMNTCALLTDTSTGERTKCTLVFPGEANPQCGKLSVLSELGIALLGFSVGDTIDWESPEGPRRTRIVQFSFQPEAAKQYDD